MSRDPGLFLILWDAVKNKVPELKSAVGSYLSSD